MGTINMDATSEASRGGESRWVAFMRALLPDPYHPAARQPTPFGLNRYILLFIHSVIVFLTSSVYFGWSPLSTMLFSEGFYANRCSEAEQRLGIVCEAQDVAVQSLFTITYATHFTMSAVAGFLKDTAGPKVTAVLGQALNICGWFLLGACNEDMDAAIPAFMLIGAGADMCYIPMMCICSLFPGSSGMGITTMGASCSLSFAIPSVLMLMNNAGLSFRAVCWIYAAVGPLLCLFIVLLFVPLNGYIDMDLYVVVPEISDARFASSVLSNRKLTSILTAKKSAIDSAETKVSAVKEYNLQPKPTVAGSQISAVTDEDFFRSFKQEATTFLYIGICVYFSICSIAMSYYQQAAAKFLEPSVFSLLEYATPLSTFPCLILGRLADFVPIMYILAFVNTTGLLSYLFAVIDAPPGVAMLSVVFFSLYISILTSQMYIFIKILFTSLNFGKLIGVASMFGSIIALISNVLYDNVTVRDGEYKRVMWGMIGIISSVYILFIPMGVLATRKRRKMLNGPGQRSVSSLQPSRARPSAILSGDL